MVNNKSNIMQVLNKGTTPYVRTLIVAFIASLFFVSIYSCNKGEPPPAVVPPPPPPPIPTNKEIKFTVGSRLTLSQSMFPQSIAGYFTDGAVPVLKINDKYYAFWLTSKLSAPSQTLRC